MKLKTPIFFQDGRHALEGYYAGLHVDLNVLAFSAQKLQLFFFAQCKSVKGRCLVSLLLCITLPPSPDGGNTQWQQEHSFYF